MNAVIRVECAACGPLEDSTETMVETRTACHERNYGDDHDIEVVVR